MQNTKSSLGFKSSSVMAVDGIFNLQQMQIGIRSRADITQQEPLVFLLVSRGCCSCRVFNG